MAINDLITVFMLVLMTFYHIGDYDDIVAASL